MTDKRKAYEEKLDAQLKEWNAQIALLKAKAENAKADAKIDSYKTIETLEHKQVQAKTKLQQLKTMKRGERRQSTRLIQRRSKRSKP